MPIIKLREIPVKYVNLDRDVEKRERMEHQLKSFGFENFSRVPAVEDKVNGPRGLAETFFSILDTTEPPFLLLEDDISIVGETSSLSLTEEADAMYLGSSLWGIVSGNVGLAVDYRDLIGEPASYRIFNMLSTHAILYLNSDYVQACRRAAYLSAQEPSIAVDIGFAELQKYFQVLCLKEPLFVQTPFRNQMSSAPEYTQYPLSFFAPIKHNNRAPSLTFRLLIRKYYFYLYRKWVQRRI